MEGNVNSLEARMRQLIRDLLDGRPDWKRLEAATALPAVRWRHFMGGVKKPSVEMLAALFRTYPQHAFWLATGVSDEDSGHLAPGLRKFPGKLPKGESSQGEQEATATYFRECQQVLDTLQEVAKSNFAEMNGREPTADELAQLDPIDWLKSDRLPQILGKERQSHLLQRLARLQQDHLRQTILRLRLYNARADSIIDEQRAEEEALERELEQNLGKGKNGGKKG